MCGTRTLLKIVQIFIHKLGDLIFTPEIGAELQKGVDDLTASGINKIIALGHAGIEIDKEVAQSVRGVDIVIGGHSNTFLYSGECM